MPRIVIEDTRTLAERAHIEETAARIGYRPPPPELEPRGRMGEDPRCHELAKWSRDTLPPGPASRHGAFDTAILVYLARKCGTTIPKAYAATDSWMRTAHARVEREDDPASVVSFN